MQEPEVAPHDRLPAGMSEYYVDDWLFVGLLPLKKGQIIEQHVHTYDHPTVVPYGTVHLWVDGEDKGEITGPTYATIKAGQRHRFVAVSDTMILCCHNLRGEGYPAISEA
jgi:quercetin dioxygenase-like cupin family protein